MENLLWQHIQHVKKSVPLIHNITNYVVMNNTANALLAAGASPIMSHAQSEVEDMVNICQALVVNIGTLDEYWSLSMIKAAKKANELGKPWILDPVGAGATPYRNDILTELLQLKPKIIRGNASEIMALAKASDLKTKGVDSTAASSEAIEAANALNTEYDSVVCISGETDIIIDGNKIMMLNNGDSLMAKVTGLGCSASAITAAFAAVVEDKFEATLAAMALLGVCGELAAKTSAGPGTLQLNILDKLYNITEEEFMSTLKISE
ncbi:hydroxyethylthiazole kinase [Zunongwangia endophytica]|uniref:Hydroxyethylthiazole kinase n=1 Tax=Zunongwangia endophytica TaxID=1808945 RepID=A0ABV8HB94_9FLAO|nr:hydroxyethylthiazole kinase [Zunongwangia endophytica]MDN3593748.1 hydroxyethylthiazole kinase [Zunongwangia endophytica]